MDEIKPWAQKAFELIFHAEHHFRNGTDYDKRLALISFDNSIEVSITIYLNLHPSQRGGREIKNDDKEKSLRSYFSKLEFYESELIERGLTVHKDKGTIQWLHEQRNELYHGSSGGVPTLDTLQEIRFVATWIYSILFEDTDIEERLEVAINDSVKTEPKPATIQTTPSLSELSEILSSEENVETIVISSLAGKWDESNPHDMEIVKRLTDEF